MFNQRLTRVERGDNFRSPSDAIELLACNVRTAMNRRANTRRRPIGTRSASCLLVCAVIASFRASGTGGQVVTPGLQPRTSIARSMASASVRRHLVAAVNLSVSVEEVFSLERSIASRTCVLRCLRVILSMPVECFSSLVGSSTIRTNMFRGLRR